MRRSWAATSRTRRIFPEPLELDVVVEHGGFAWFELAEHGVRGCRRRSGEGVDAIALDRALADIRRSTAELGRPARPTGEGGDPRLDDLGRRPAAGLPVSLHGRGRALPDPGRDLAAARRTNSQRCWRAAQAPIRELAASSARSSAGRDLDRPRTSRSRPPCSRRPRPSSAGRPRSAATSAGWTRGSCSSRASRA